MWLSAACNKWFHLCLCCTSVWTWTSIVLLPNIYIIVKQLSNANPTMNRKKANDAKLNEYADATPPMKPSILVPTNAGIRPYRSAIMPNMRPPKMAPQKKIDWAKDGSAALSHTHSYYVKWKIMRGKKQNLNFHPFVPTCNRKNVKPTATKTYFSGNCRIRHFIFIEFPSILARHCGPFGIRLSNIISQ